MLLPEQGAPEQCRPVSGAPVRWLLQQQIQYGHWDAHLWHLWNKMGKEGNIISGQGVCRNIQHPRHMLCRKMEFIVSCIEKQGAEQVVHSLILCSPIDQHRNNSHVVRVKTDMTSLPLMAPHSCCHDNRDQLLLGYRHVQPASWPLNLKPTA